jgi:uncharacterized protein (UPF0333 family)
MMTLILAKVGGVLAILIAVAVAFYATWKKGHTTGVASQQAKVDAVTAQAQAIAKQANAVVATNAAADATAAAAGVTALQAAGADRAAVDSAVAAKPAPEVQSELKTWSRD